jgi:hypothetical protein
VRDDFQREKKEEAEGRNFEGEGVLKARGARRGEEGRASGVAWLPQALISVTCAGQRGFFFEL